MKRVFNKLEGMRENTFGVFLLSPTIILLLIFIAFPIGYSIFLSMTDYATSRGFPAEFIGLGNYTEMLRNPIFLSSLWKTGYFSIIFLFSTTVIGMLIALLLNQKFIGRNFVIGCLLIPWAIPKVVNGLIWKWIYDGNYGIFNAIMVKLGLIDQYQFWFGHSPLVAILLISIANAWKLMPFVALLLLAALQTIPRELYESAKVDGANPIRRFYHITIPQLRYPLIIIFILQTTAAVK
ncbi:MAG: carbohydrate ABC transporter permease, partial [Spirochaetia bacterium]